MEDFLKDEAIITEFKYRYGKKIRKYHMLDLVWYAFSLFTFSIIIKNLVVFGLDNFNITDYLGFIIFTAILTLAAFGEKFCSSPVCSVSEKGLHTSKGIVKWENVVGIRYYILFVTHSTGYQRRPQYSPRVEILCSDDTENIIIDFVSPSIIRLMKKYAPHIKVAKTKELKVIFAFITVAAPVLAIFI